MGVSFLKWGQQVNQCLNTTPLQDDTIKPCKAADACGIEMKVQIASSVITKNQTIVTNNNAITFSFVSNILIIVNIKALIHDISSEDIMEKNRGRD